MFYKPCYVKPKLNMDEAHINIRYHKFWLFISLVAWLLCWTSLFAIIFDGKPIIKNSSGIIIDSLFLLLLFGVNLTAGPLGVLLYSFRLKVSSIDLSISQYCGLYKRSYALSNIEKISFKISNKHPYKSKIKLMFNDGRKLTVSGMVLNFNTLKVFLSKNLREKLST